jgi:hypothetical protein
MKTASIYMRPEEGYIIFGSSKTVSGFRISSEPFIKIQEDEANTDAVVNAIKASLNTDDTKRVPDPKNWSEHNKNFLKKIGLKSLKELDNPTTKCVSIGEDESKIIFTPTRSAKKPDKGFLHKSPNEAVTVLATASNQDIFASYELALSKCD